MVLEEYKDTLGTLAASLGMFHLVIPGGICLQMIRRRSTENVSVAHFIIGGCITLMHMRRGQLLNSPHIVSSAAVGFTLTMLYLSVYVVYSENRKNVFRLTGKCFAVPLLAILYTFLDEETRAEKVYGTFCGAMMFCLMAFPLYQVKKAFDQKHTGELSLAMALFGTVHSTLWFLYSLALGNLIEIFSRFFFFAVISIQLIPFCLFPMPTSSHNTKKAD